MISVGRAGLAAWLVAAAVFVASAAGAFESSLVRIETGGGKGPAAMVRVELALSAAERSQGLQGRKKLAADAGMLFDFGATQPVAMWMKNTYVALDMLFIDDTGFVVHLIENTIPLSETLLEPNVPVRAVLELAAGSARRLGVRPGDRVRHPMFESRR